MRNTFNHLWAFFPFCLYVLCCIQLINLFCIIYENFSYCYSIQMFFKVLLFIFRSHLHGAILVYICELMKESTCSMGC
jgi:hypothetical protein